MWNGGVGHYDGGEWTMLPTDAGFLGASRIWGSAANDVYLAEDEDAVFHFDGLTWTQIHELDDVKVAAISGSGRDDVWVLDNVLGSGLPRAFHWDGAQWTAIDTPSASLSTLFVADPHTMWVSGVCGQIIRQTH
jgi:hypothetical protein